MTSETIHVAVLGRNQTLFHCVFITFEALWCRTSGVGLIRTALVHGYLRSLRVAHTNHTLNGHSALQHFERSNMVESTKIITFDLYPGLRTTHA